MLNDIVSGESGSGVRVVAAEDDRRLYPASTSAVHNSTTAHLPVVMDAQWRHARCHGRPVAPRTWQRGSSDAWNWPGQVGSVWRISVFSVELLPGRSGRVVSASDCGVRRPGFESCRRRWCLSRQLLWCTLYSLVHWLCTFSAVPGSTQPSTLCGTVTWVSAYGLKALGKWFELWVLNMQ